MSIQCVRMNHQRNLQELLVCLLMFARSRRKLVFNWGYATISSYRNARDQNGGHRNNHSTYLEQEMYETAMLNDCDAHG